MTLEQLRSEAFSQGYRLTKIKAQTSYNKWTPCTCGGKMRKHINKYDKSIGKMIYLVECSRCGKQSPRCFMEEEVKSAWNEKIAEERRKHGI